MSKMTQTSLDTAKNEGVLQTPNLPPPPPLIWGGQLFVDKPKKILYPITLLVKILSEECHTSKTKVSPPPPPLIFGNPQSLQTIAMIE